MQRNLRLLLIAVVVVVSGCAGLWSADPTATQEFRHYQNALRAQHDAATRVLDRLSRAEGRLLTLEAAAAPDGFDPNAAAAVLGVGDPPRTATLRRALETLSAYNQSLVAVGMGAPEMALTTGLLMVEGILPAAPGRPGAEFDRLNTAIRRLLPVLGAARTSSDRDRIRSALADATPEVQALLRAVRDATPAVYGALRAAAIEPGNLTYPDGIPPAGQARLEEDRRMLAGWVLLIDQTMVAVEVAAMAARTGDRADASALVAAAFRLRALAEAASAARWK